MDNKFLKTGLLLLAIQIVTTFVCWLVFRDEFFIAAPISILPMFAVFFAKRKHIAK